MLFWRKSLIVIAVLLAVMGGIYLLSLAWIGIVTLLTLASQLSLLDKILTGIAVLIFIVGGIFLLIRLNSSGPTLRVAPSRAPFMKFLKILFSPVGHVFKGLSGVGKNKGFKLPSMSSVVWSVVGILIILWMLQPSNWDILKAEQMVTPASPETPGVVVQGSDVDAAPVNGPDGSNGPKGLAENIIRDMVGINLGEKSCKGVGNIITSLAPKGQPGDSVTVYVPQNTTISLFSANTAEALFCKADGSHQCYPAGGGQAVQTVHAKYTNLTDQALPIWCAYSPSSAQASAQSDAPSPSEQNSRSDEAAQTAYSPGRIGPNDPRYHNHDSDGSDDSPPQSPE